MIITREEKKEGKEENPRGGARKGMLRRSNATEGFE